MTNPATEPGADGSSPIPSDEMSQHASFIKNFLHNVEMQVGFNMELLEQAGSVANISHMLQALKDLDKGPLGAYKQLNIFSFEFHPPVDIPVHTEKAIKTIKDKEFDLALAVIGEHVGQFMDQSVGKPALPEQILASHIAGVTLIQPAVVSLSNIGYMMFKELDEFDHTGAVINGKPMETVKGINITDAGQSFVWIRPEILRTDAMVNTLTLQEIDEWRISRLKVVGSMAQESRADSLSLQSIFAGVQIGRIFEQQ